MKIKEDKIHYHVMVIGFVPPNRFNKCSNLKVWSLDLVAWPDNTSSSWYQQHPIDFHATARSILRKPMRDIPTTPLRQTGAIYLATTTFDHLGPVTNTV